VPNERSRHPARYCDVSAGEMNNGNHSVIRIAETKIWNMVAYGARLLAVSTRRQHDNGGVPIGCGKFVAVEIDKIDRVSAAS
jgi:hypothetical protein